MMRRAISRTGQWSVYVVFRAVAAVIRLLPIGFVFVLGGMLGKIAHRVSPGYRRLAARNVRGALGGCMGDTGVAATVRRAFYLLGANLLSGIKLSAMSTGETEERIELGDGASHPGDAAPGVGVIFAISHMACWEVLAQIPQLFPIRLEPRPAVLYQPLGNVFLDRYVKRVREDSGLDLIGRGGGMRELTSRLRAGAAIGILVDQHAGDKGVWCPFFGRLASTSNLAALLSARSGAPVVPVGLHTIGKARWRIDFGERILPPTDGSINAATALLNQHIAVVIARSPADWFWVHRRWKTPQPNFLLQRYKRGITLPPGVTTSDLKKFRILVRSPNWLGDACMAVPAVRAIKRGRPDAHVTVLTPAKLAGLWKNVDDVDSVMEMADGASVLAVGRAIRNGGGERPFDVGVLLPNSTRSALEMRAGKVPEIVGFAGSFRRKLLTSVAKERRRPGPVEHHANHFLRLTAELGAAAGGTELFAPMKPVTSRDAGPGVPPPLVGVCPGAEYGPAKRWPSDRFAAAVSVVAKAEPDVRWALFGVAGDAPHGAAVEDVFKGEAARRCQNFIGNTSLEGLIDELRRCTVLLTNDTGTMHLAALLGVPVVAVFGSTEPAWTGPFGEGHRVFRHHVDCSPCFLRECPFDFRCMTGVAPGPVAEAVLETVREAAASPAGATE